ncbi:tryptophan synthase beta subunit-like PLP-dependent enzyme [Flammula alnicola]|nr:tryptophan synthase beta subunit-like PLP-dependent enzyme [Flammula alnicola]
MKYFSTRGGDQRLSFEETVLTGLAPNGGLYIPESIPSLPADWRTKWSKYSFVDLSVAVLSLYISPEEISTRELRSLVEKSYETFRHPDITPVKKLDDKTFILELFHGPTFAFKDVALQLLGNLFEFFLLRRNARKGPGETQEKLTVVGATSGDTGSAAIYGLRNKANISIFILHPKGRVSPIQEAQMTTVTDANVHNVAVKGTFDDCQDIVKALFADKGFNAKHRLGAVNSINWARILAQTVYYFLSFFHFQAQLPAGTSIDDVEIQYVVPTGNFGDILAGYYAKKMGLPIGKLAIATNANDILARFWKSGRYEKVDSSVSAGEGAAAPAVGSSDGKQATDASGVKETLSPAMDILVSSNFERLLWYLAFQNAAGADVEEKRRAACKTLDGWMSRMKSDGRVEVPIPVLETAREDFLAERVSDDLVSFFVSVFGLHHYCGSSYCCWPRSGSHYCKAKVSPTRVS